MKGDRVGLAFQQLFSFFNECNAQVVAYYARKNAGDPTVAQAHLGMLREDISAYMLLGDPAARLPLAAPRPAPRLSGEQAANLLGLPLPAAAVEALPADLDTLEQAFAEVLAGYATLKGISVKLGVSQATLERLLRAYSTAGREACRRAAGGG